MLNSINKKVKKTLAVSLSLAAMVSSMATLPSFSIKPSAMPIRQDQGIDVSNGITWEGGYCRHTSDYGVIRNKWVPHPDNDGSECYVGNDGRMVTNKWFIANPDDDNDAWRYAGRDGRLITDQWVPHPDIDGTLCYVDIDGEMCFEAWVPHPANNDSECYVGNDGRMRVNAWVPHPGGGRCYVGNDGRMVANQWVPHPDGNARYVDVDGRMVTNQWVPHQSEVNAFLELDYNGIVINIRRPAAYYFVQD